MVLGPDCLIAKDDIVILIEKLLLYENSIIVTPTSYDTKMNYRIGRAV